VSKASSSKRPEVIPPQRCPEALSGRTSFTSFDSFTFFFVTRPRVTSFPLLLVVSAPHTDLRVSLNGWARRRQLHCHRRFHARAHAFRAVAWAAFWNLRCFRFGTAGAKTIAKAGHSGNVSQQFVRRRAARGPVSGISSTLILACLPVQRTP